MAGHPLALDASTAILLAKIDLLRVVVGQGKVLMGMAAYREATVKDTDDAKIIRLLVEEQSITTIKVKANPSDLRRDFRLDLGEAETILLAQERGAICGTDDGPAIRACKVLGLPFTSAIALLPLLAERGWVKRDLALELLAKLETFGRYNARILEDAGRKIRATGSSKEGGGS